MRREVRPRVVAICGGGLEGDEHQAVCLAVAHTLGKWQPIQGVGVLAPFCERLCWHSCKGESHTGGADDGFMECPSEGCAQDSCLDFLLRECPPVVHEDIQKVYEATCTVAPPSPPSPPLPPPPPPLPTWARKPPPPHPPPPAPYLERRGKATEEDWDPDCDMVSYAQCRGVVADYAREAGAADVLKVSVAPCEGLGAHPSRAPPFLRHA